MKHMFEVDQKNGFKGHVEIEVPPHHKRQAVVLRLRADRYVAVAKLKGDALHAALDINMPILDGAYEACRPYIKAVDIKGPEGSEPIMSLDELESREETSSVWQQIAAKFIQGFGPGKSSGKS